MDKDNAKPLNRLDGWDKGEYIAMLHKEIDKFYQPIKLNEYENYKFSLDRQKNHCTH